MDNTSEVKKNYLLTSLYQLVYVITPLITTPYISRILGANGIGDYSFAFSVATYFTMFIRLGVVTYGNRAIATVRDNNDQMSKTFCEIYSLQFSCGCVFVILYLTWAFLRAPQTGLSICLLLYVLSAMIDITWLFYGVEDFLTTTIRDVGVRILTVICIFAIVRESSDVWKYTLIQGAGFFVGQLISWFRVKKYVSFSRVSIKDVLSHLKPDLVLFIPFVAVSIYKTMDKIMLGSMSGSIELGYYESSEKVINVPMAFIIALGTVMLPRMTNMMANSEDEDRIKEVIYKSLIFVTFLSTLLCFGIMSVANQFVPLFYGQGFEKCIEVYIWLLPSCVFLAYANVIRTQFLLPKKRDKQFIVSLFAGAGVNLVLNLILIPRYASIGAAMATLAAEAMVCIVQIFYVYEELDVAASLVKILPFVLAGVGMFVLFHSRIVNYGGQVSSLMIKIVECGIVYVVIAGLFIGAYRGIHYVYAGRNER